MEGPGVGVCQWELDLGVQVGEQKESGDVRVGLGWVEQRESGGGATTNLLHIWGVVHEFLYRIQYD